MKTPLLQKGCPWSVWNHWAPPNIDWCEQSLCSWIVEPANTWSNLAFFLVALYIWWVARGPARAMRRFAYIALLTGAFSFVYHASLNFVTQLFDFVGMFLFLGLLVALNLQRMDLLARKFHIPFLLIMTLSLGIVTIIFYIAGIPFQMIVMVLVLVVIILEWILYHRSQINSKIRFRWFYLALVFLAIGSVFSFLDLKGILCNPQNHFFQGHAVWHLCSAISILFSYYHYRQFSKKLILE